jgi:hypothetical protein
MSTRHGVWKNRSDGKTVKRNTLAVQFSSRPVELLRSPAYRSLSRWEHLALSRIEIELRNHGGNANGKLIVTTQQFADYGIERRKIPAALRALEALGIVGIPVRGRGGNAEHRQPNQFLLNYLCGAIDAHDQVTNAWTKPQTMAQAQEIARVARAAKDKNRVAYSRRIARKQKRFPGAETVPSPGTETAPENGNFPGTESEPTGPGTETVPTIEISGGGGGRGGKSPKKSRKGAVTASVFAEVELDGEWQRCGSQLIGQAAPARARPKVGRPLNKDGLSIPTFLLRGHPDCVF